MKKVFLFIIVAVITCITAKSQEYIYCQIVGAGKILSNKVTVEIDFGQQTGLFTDKRLRDEKGKVIEFNSMVDAMNFMGADGWEFMQAYVITLDTGMTKQNVYHWLLKKRMDSLSPEEKEEVMNRLNTKKK